MNQLEINCPICNSISKLKKQISKEKIIKNLETYFDCSIDADLDLIDYSIFKCQKCKYTFSYPFVDGSNNFYTWITNRKKYYPTFRWEYGKVSDILLERNYKSIIDVGCGDGMYLNFLKSIKNNLTLYGLDTTKTSIENCHQIGLQNTFCETVENFKLKTNQKFDVVTLFHVLEHISNPISFVEELKGLISQNGIIAISTPYSPMDFEYYWFDILNSPPHHMGFWNERSYRQLAAKLNMNIEVIMDPNVNFKNSLINALNLSVYGTKPAKNNPYILLFSHPIKTLKITYKLLTREKVNNLRAGNVILILLSHKN